MFADRNKNGILGNKWKHYEYDRNMDVGCRFATRNSRSIFVYVIKM